VQTKKNRRGCRRFWWVRVLRATYALTSPAAVRGENQK
jgi:hypothetical protein